MSPKERCEHCGAEMPDGAMFGPNGWTPWQPSGASTFTQFCPACREHNPVGSATRKQQRRTWETMIRRYGGRR